ncbi:MAG: PLP-dependent aminotransferase family protein [Clostridiales bacterium]|nr:PLP-dependent aminotransferase family protein [Clostridiales bacterium]
MIAEDDPYHELRYKGKSLPSIKSFDNEGWVVLLGSFSKVISPGLRIGFMAGDAHLLQQCAVCKQSTDVHTPNLNQAIVDVFLRENLLDNHIAKITPLYSELMETMLNKIVNMPGILNYTKPEGGLFIFATLAEELEAVPLFKITIEKGLSFVPGEYFYVQSGHKNTLRLNFSSADKADIMHGMDLLKNSIKQMQ